MLHRKDPFKDKDAPKDHLARLHVAKQKNGPEGFVTLYFRDEILRFENYTKNGAEDNAITKPIEKPKPEPPSKPQEERLPYKDSESDVHEDGTPRWVPDEDDIPF